MTLQVQTDRLSRSNAISIFAVQAAEPSRLFPIFAMQTSTAPAYKLPDGPVVPGFTTLITALLPVRVEFDNLTYMTSMAQKFGPFYGIYIGDKSSKNVTYVISDPELAHEILVQRHAEFHKAELLRKAIGGLIGNGLLLSEGDFWKRQRKLAQPAFHHQRIAAYGSTMVQQALAMLAGWQVGQTRDIALDMMALALDIVNRTLFGVTLNEQAEEIGRLMHIILERANDRINQYEPVWEKLFKTRHKQEAEAGQALFKIVDDIIAEHRRRNVDTGGADTGGADTGGADTGDLLSMLMAARDEDDQPMSEAQLRAEVMTLFIAGHETTANALSWGFYLVSQTPQVEAKLMQEIAQLNGQPPTLKDLQNMPYSEQVVKEVMRLYPPAGGATRQPIQDTHIGNYFLPKGSNIAISTYTMHRNPALFPDPLQFKPERFSPEQEASIPKYAYLPFGGGPRVCIGNSFAIMEARLVLITVLQRFKLALAPGQKVRAEQLFTIRPKGGLKMVLEARQS